MSVIAYLICLQPLLGLQTPFGVRTAIPLPLPRLSQEECNVKINQHADQGGVKVLLTRFLIPLGCVGSMLDRAGVCVLLGYVYHRVLLSNKQDLLQWAVDGFVSAPMMGLLEACTLPRHQLPVLTPRPCPKRLLTHPTLSHIQPTPTHYLTHVLICNGFMCQTRHHPIQQPTNPWPCPRPHSTALRTAPASKSNRVQLYI